MAHSGKSITFATDLLPNEDKIYNLGTNNQRWKIYGELQPLETKTYENVIATLNTSNTVDQATGGFFYGKVRGTTYDTVWSVTIRVTATVPGQTSYNTVTIYKLCATANTYLAYSCWNAIKNTNARPIYYNTYYRINSTGYNNNMGGWLGFSLYSSTNPTNTSYKRTVKVELLECNNCTVELQDNLITPANIPNVSTSGYYNSATTGYDNFDAYQQGLRESGDVDSNDSAGYIRHFQNSSYIKPTTAMGRYILLLDKGDGQHVIPIHATQASSNANQQVTNKSNITTTAFNIFGPIEYYSTTANIAAEGNIDGRYHWTMRSDVDLRYSFNIGTTLTAYKDVYLVATLETATTAKLRNPSLVDANAAVTANSGPISQTLPTTEDGYIYIKLGHAYSTSAIILTLDHPIYYYKNGALQIYTPYAAEASKAAIVTTTNAIARYSDTTGSFSDSTTTINDNGTITVKGKIMVNPSYDTTSNNYNDGVRINQCSTGWADVVLGGTADSTSGTSVDTWLVGRRGAAGSKVGAVGDFTIENNSSNGIGLTIHQTSGGATLYTKLAYNQSQLKIWNDNSIAASKFGYAINAVSAMAANSNNIILVGAANSTKNQAYLGFHYEGSGSNSNYLTLGLYSVDHILKIYGDKKVEITTDTDASATNAAAFIISGGVGIAKTLYVGTGANITGQTVITRTDAVSATGESSQLIIKNTTAANNVGIELIRGSSVTTTYTCWQIINKGGYLQFMSSYDANGSAASTAYNRQVLKLYPNTGNADLTGIATIAKIKIGTGTTDIQKRTISVTDTNLIFNAPTNYGFIFQENAVTKVRLMANKFYPDTTNTGSLGQTANRWGALYVGTADSYGGASTAPIYWNAGVPAAVTNILLEDSGTNNRYIEVRNSLSAVRLLVGTTGNHGLHDTLKEKWIIYNDKDAAHTYVTLWKNKGNSDTPIYFDSNGEPAPASVVRMIGWSFDNGSTGTTLSHTSFTTDTIVITIVVFSGENYLTAPITWTSASGSIILNTTTATTGAVTGYIIVAQGNDLTGSNTVTSNSITPTSQSVSYPLANGVEF